MIVLSNTAEQTLAPGQSIVFDEVVTQAGSCECHRRNTGSVKLRSNGIYSVAFSGNIGGETAATAVQLGLTLSGSAALPETTMISVPAAIADRNNVATQTRIKNCCGDYDRVSVTNTGTVPVIVAANSSFVIERRS